MGVDGNCAIYHQGMFEIAQHRFIRCPCVLLLLRAFKQLLNHWGSTSFVFSSWTHVLVGDIFSDFNDTNFHRFENHLGGFTYVNKSIDIVGTFFLFYLWSDKCASSFEDNFFLHFVHPPLYLDLHS